MKYLIFNRFLNILMLSRSWLPVKFIYIFRSDIIYEYPVPLIMKNLVKKGDVVIDIGASNGIYTIFLSKLVGKEGRVYAFEPDPRNFSILGHRTKKLNNVIIENKALSDKNDKLRLYLHNYLGFTSAFDTKNSLLSIEVECTSLDEYFKDITKHIALIKMDVQGAEFSILRGAKNLLKRVRAIIFEFEPRLIKLANEKQEDLLNFLISNGFVLFDPNLSGRNIKKIRDIEDFVRNFNRNFTNILAIKL